MNTYDTSAFPLGSDNPKVLFNNASNIDDAVTGQDPAWVDRKGIVRPTLKGMENDFASFLLSSGYEYIGDYDAPGELTFTRRNQTMVKDGQYWLPDPSLALPYTTVNNWVTDQPKFVSNGDNSLRQELAGADGTKVIGFGGRTLFDKLGEHVSCKDAPFNCVGDGVADDTAGLIAFAAYLDSVRSSGPVTSGPLTAAYTGTGPTGYIPPGTYLKHGVIPWGPYTKIVGDNAIIKEVDNDTDGFDVDLYLFEMSGIQFVGGRHHLVFSNANINSSMVKVDNCQFFLSRSYSIKTKAIGGVWTHLSADGVFNNCRWISNNMIMDNCFDSMVINDPWLQPDKTNMTPSTAQFNNRGATPLDPGAQTRLYINRGFGIPAVGTYGVDRPASIRWVDNWGSFISRDVRWGGEFGGMRIVDHLAVPDTSFPWNTTEVSVTGGVAFCGPSDDPNACIMGIQGQVPNSMTFGDYAGQVSSPLIKNLSSTDLTAYFAAFEVATGKKATEYFKLNPYRIITDLRAFTPLRPFIPDGLYPYLINGRNTRISKAAAMPSLANGGVETKVQFNTTPDYDTVAGAFVPANPTRFNMPNGCSKMRIEVDIVIDSGDNLAKAISAQLLTSAGARYKGVSGNYGVNPYGDGIHFTADVFGPPGTYWELAIKHNGTTARALTSCSVVMTPLDMII